MAFNPDKDIPSLAGKVIAITGGTGGLGAGSVTELAKHDPAQIIFTGRNAQRAEAVKATVAKTNPGVKTTFIELDVSSFDSVNQGASQIEKVTDRLDILMLNAGIMAVPPSLSKDGYEIQFATNHLGHALLVQRLLPLLETTAKTGHDVRVINMTSIAYEQAPKSGIAFDSLKTDQASLGGMGSMMAKWRRYGESKLAQLLYTKELAKHYPNITWVGIHPGVILTDLFSNVDFMTKLPVLLLNIGKKTPVNEGHYHQVWAATCDKSKLKNGEYYEPIGKTVPGNKYTNDKQLASKLWDWTQAEIASSSKQ